MKHRVLILSLLIAALIVAALSGEGVSSSGRTAARAAGPSQSPAPRPVRFIALGDAGFANAGQGDVARKIKEVCTQRGCDFAIYLGDNFYPAGVNSSHDTDLESKFENSFRDVKLPFYAALGNHDNSSTPIPGGDGHGNRAGDYQVEYHYRRDRVSNKFKMPARYYTVRHGDLQIFAMDTNAVLEDGAGTNDPGSSKQLGWLKDALAASTARWKIVFGHHTYVSNGAHGNAGLYRGLTEPQGLGGNLKTFIEQGVCGRADFFLCGHDHHLEWLKPVAACGETQFIISGAASDPRNLPNLNSPPYSLPPLNYVNETFFKAGSTALFGFWWVEVSGDTFRAVAYDARGNPNAAPPTDVLFDKTFTKPASP